MNNVRIVLDGPDGAGKTTLAKWAQHEYGMVYARFLNPMYPRDFKLTQPHECEVWDRWLSSEPIYAPLRGNHSFRDSISIADYADWTDEQDWDGNRTRVIVMLPEFEVCERNLSARESEEMFDKDERNQAWHRWQMLKSKWPSGHIFLDTPRQAKEAFSYFYRTMGGLRVEFV